VRDVQRAMSPVRRGSCRYRALKLRAARRQAKIARQRREALHRWTTGIATRFSSLTIISPPISEITRTGAGDRNDWGAAVDLKAQFNRHVLDQAPGAAIAMLEYKIAERGGATRIVTPAEHKAEIGNLIVSATKLNRELRRATNAR
jgi:putative transposase